MNLLKRVEKMVGYYDDHHIAITDCSSPPHPPSPVAIENVHRFIYRPSVYTGQRQSELRQVVRYHHGNLQIVYWQTYQRRRSSRRAKENK